MDIPLQSSIVICKKYASLPVGGKNQLKVWICARIEGKITLPCNDWTVLVPNVRGEAQNTNCIYVTQYMILSL